ncbi:hypothetical protein AMQ83_13185 [Paenibacillus riograndensis]|nr:hypothetical protein AMQ83_13185 [Paenibacillus riograndensis]
MKLDGIVKLISIAVAPYVGAWTEISKGASRSAQNRVAPYEERTSKLLERKPTAKSTGIPPKPNSVLFQSEFILCGIQKV